jgi:hypothetical protein
MLKKCSKCKEEKKFSEFSKDKYSKSGLKYWCKNCTKNYRKNNKELIFETHKKYYDKNKDKILSYSKSWREINKEEINKKTRNKYNENKDKERERKKRYRENNKEKERLRIKKWYEENKEKVIERSSKYERNRRLTDTLFKFKKNVRSLVRDSFKRGSIDFMKNTKTEEILGCSIKEFRDYIEYKFTEGMTFENHGLNGWHLDHIIPLFTAKTEEDVIRLNHYTNFQPLWAKDNLRKGSKL